MSEQKATYNHVTAPTSEPTVQEMLEALRVARFVTFDGKRYMEINDWLIEHTKYGYYIDHEKQCYVERQSIEDH